MGFYRDMIARESGSTTTNGRTTSKDARLRDRFHSLKLGTRRTKDGHTRFDPEMCGFGDGGGGGGFGAILLCSEDQATNRRTLIGQS